MLFNSFNVFDFYPIFSYNLRYNYNFARHIVLDGIRMERRCPRCNAVLARDNTGKYCSPCQKKRLDERTTYDDELVDAEGFGAIIGLSATQVKRLAPDKLPPRIPGIKKYLWRRKDIDVWIEQKQKEQIQAREKERKQRGNRVFRTVARGIASNLRTCCNARMGQTLSDKIGDKVYGLKAGEYFFGLTAAGQVEPIELLNVDRSIAVKMLERLSKKDFPELIGITDWANLTYGSINEDLIIRLDTYF